MKQKLLIAAAATALMAAPSFASAQDGSGWYLKGAAGYGIGTDLNFTGTVVGDAEAEGDVAGNIAIGYDFGNNWRIELDGTTLLNDYGLVSQAPSSSAKLRTDAVMVNAIYDFDDFGKFAPYVGAGVGLVNGEATLQASDFPSVDGVRTINPTCNANRLTIDAFSCDFDDRDIAVGWQLLAGLGYNITDNLTWDTNYRYMQVDDLDLQGFTRNSATGAGTSGLNVNVEDVGAHMLLTGFRYRFGAPKAADLPPPPPPPPPPSPDYQCADGSFVFDSAQCPVTQVAPAQPTVRCWDGSFVFDAGQCPAEPALVTCPDGSQTSDINFCPTTDRSTTIGDICGDQYRQEIIYYEFDKGASAETRNTISRILDAGQFCNVDNIRVIGHTDTSGAASYNLALSKRRATDALNELVRQGIDRNVITAEGKGETEPFVQTGDGVKEQLNRRTEVLITLSSVGAIN